MTHVSVSAPLLLAALIAAEPAASQDAGRRVSKHPASSQEGQAVDSVLRKSVADTLPPPAAAPAGKARETRASEPGAPRAGTPTSTGTSPPAGTGVGVQGGAGKTSVRPAGPPASEETTAPPDTSRGTQRARPALPRDNRKKDPR